MDDSKREEAKALIAEARQYERRAPIGSLFSDPGRSLMLALTDALEAVLTLPADPTDDERKEPRECHCEDCDRDYTVWYADNDFWNAVMRPNGQTEIEPFLCATCFLIRADQAGVAHVARVALAEGAGAPVTRMNLAESIEDNAGVDWLNGSADELAEVLLSRFIVTKKH